MWRYVIREAGFQSCFQGRVPNIDRLLKYPLTKQVKCCTFVVRHQRLLMNALRSFLLIQGTVIIIVSSNLKLKEYDSNNVFFYFQINMYRKNIFEQWLFYRTLLGNPMSNNISIHAV